MNLKHSLLTAALLAVVATSAHAGQAITTFDVSVEVVSDCSIQADDLTFPQVGLLTNNVDASSNLQIYCTAAVPYNIEMAAGAGGFQLVNGAGDDINYALYQDAARSIVWDHVSVMNGTSVGGIENFTVYGRIPPQPSVLADTYTQTMTAAINF